MLTDKQQENLKILAKYLGKDIRKLTPPTVTEFSRENFYIPETGAPLHLLPHQSSILEYAFDRAHRFSTIIYSTIKKSGKTAVGALIARWIAETWGQNAEVILAANDYEQARGRIYEKIVESLRLNPNFLPIKRELPGKWKVIERQLTYLPTNSTIRSISGDYKGEAGSNPTASIFSELWAYSKETSRRLWEELTPVATRERSIRFVETYAGYEDESDILWDLYKLVHQGRRLTHDDINWPFPDQPPIWVNERAKLFAYWDEGIVARRMPWQTEEYYIEQEQLLRPMAYKRLHLNEWTTSVSPFIPIEWWDRCFEQLPPLDKNTPIVIGADAAVSSDCCALVGVSRHPNRPQDICLRFADVWYPPSGGTINLSDTVDKSVRQYCKDYNIVQVAYDEYQLHNIMTNLTTEGICWCKKFSQFSQREIADKQLYDLIRDKRFAHNGNDNVRDHIRNASAKTMKDEDSRLRIVKKASQTKIDAAVALSMAASECLRLIL